MVAAIEVYFDPEAQRRLRVIARLLRNELTFVQLGGALEALFGLRQFGSGSPHVGRIFDLWQVRRISGAVLGERPRMRGALLVEVVLELLTIELNKRLSRNDAIAKVGPDATNDAVHLRRDCHLVFSCQCTHDVEAASYRFLTDRFGLDRLARLFGLATLLRARVRASGDARQSADHYQYEDDLWHKT